MKLTTFRKNDFQTVKLRRMRSHQSPDAVLRTPKTDADVANSMGSMALTSSAERKRRDEVKDCAAFLIRISNSFSYIKAFFNCVLFLNLKFFQSEVHVHEHKAEGNGLLHY